MKDVIVTAHSGCEGTARDSLESVFRAIQCGADALEVDVRIDQRGVLRISHDHNATMEEYTQCRTLQEVFAAVAQTNLRVNCDMKEAELTHEVIALAKAYGLGRDRLWMTGAISPEQLAREPGLRTDVTFFVNIEEIFKFLYLQEMPLSQIPEFGTLMTVPWTYTKDWMKDIMPERIRQVAALCRVIGADGVNIPQWNLSDELFKTFAEEEIPLSIWTVDEEAAARQILTQTVSSVQNITTRQVRMVQRVRDEIRGADPN